MKGTLRKRRSLPVRIVLGVFIVAVTWVVVQEGYRALSFNDEKMRMFTGVRNLGRVNAHLYRGAQPTAEGYAALRAIGVDTVLRLSLADEGGVEEEKAVTALGMRYVSIPETTARPPTDDQSRRFLTFIRDNPQRVIFVHCKWGADRTGVMIAIDRITFDHWPASKAIDEMNAFHYHETFLPHLQHYVETFDPAKVLSTPGSDGKS